MACIAGTYPARDGAAALQSEMVTAASTTNKRRLQVHGLHDPGRAQVEAFISRVFHER